MWEGMGFNQYSFSSVTVLNLIVQTSEIISHLHSGIHYFTHFIRTTSKLVLIRIHLSEPTSTTWLYSRTRLCCSYSASMCALLSVKRSAEEQETTQQQIVLLWRQCELWPCQRCSMNMSFLNNTTRLSRLKHRWSRTRSLSRASPSCFARF